MICRRSFLKGGAVAAGTTAVSGSWFAFSNNRAARWGRRLVADAQRKISPAPAKPDPAKWPDDRITMAWLGHSSVLINFYGMHILTDPVLKSRCGISTGFGTLGPKRLTAPALSVKELPRIDAADFQIGNACDVVRRAGLETRDTAGSEALGGLRYDAAVPFP